MVLALPPGLVAQDPKAHDRKLIAWNFQSLSNVWVFEGKAEVSGGLMCQLEGPSASSLLLLQPQGEPNSLLARPAGPWDGGRLSPQQPLSKGHFGFPAMQGQVLRPGGGPEAEIRQMHMKNGDCPRHP